MTHGSHDLRLTTDIGPFAQTLLDLEATTAEAYDRFVFRGDPQLADEVRRVTFARGVADFSPPTARLLFDGDHGEPVGMLALVPDTLFIERRRAAALAVGRVLHQHRATAVRERMAEAGAISLKAEPGDLVLARIAIAKQAEGRGYGRWLIERAADEARALGCARLVLDVAADNPRAFSLYSRSGFVELARRTVSSPSSPEVELTYCHLACPL